MAKPLQPLADIEAVEMDSFINWSLLKEPYNWITVALMTAFALILLSLLMPSSQDE